MIFGFAAAKSECRQVNNYKETIPLDTYSKLIGVTAFFYDAKFSFAKYVYIYIYMYILLAKV